MVEALAQGMSEACRPQARRPVQPCCVLTVNTALIVSGCTGQITNLRGVHSLTPFDMELRVHCRTRNNRRHIDAGTSVSGKVTEMSDDKSKVGKPDRDRVSSKERYEVGQVAKKHGLPPSLVEKVIKQEGPMRKDIDSYLERMKKNGK